MDLKGKIQYNFDENFVIKLYLKQSYYRKKFINETND